MGFLSRLLRSLSPSQRDRDHRDEIAFHLESRTAEYMTRGFDREEARARALARFGREVDVREQMRAGDGVPWLDGVTGDLGHLVRSLRRDARFTILITLSLMLGVGATVGLFDLANDLLYRPLPVREPDRLVAIRASEGDNTVPLAGTMVERIRDEGEFEVVCGLLTLSATVEIEDRIAPLAVHPMTGECFEPMGVRAALGRVLTGEDEQDGRAHVAVLTWDTWTTEFGGRHDVLDRMIDVDGTPYQVVGVIEQGFTGYAVGQPARLFIPFGNFAGGLRAYFPPPDLQAMEVIARRKDGDSLDAVAARVAARWPAWLQETVSPRLRDAAQRQYLSRQPLVTSGATGLPIAVRDRLGRPVLGLLIVAVVTLFMGCVNAANLVLARAAARRREAAVRLALGASMQQLVRESIVESVPVLIGVGLGAPLIGAAVVEALIRRYQHAAPGFGLPTGPDWRASAFAAIVTLAAWVLLAGLPAWRMSRTDARLGLTTARSMGDNSRTRRFLVVGQVGLTTILLVAGSVFVDQLLSLRSKPAGFAVDGLWSAQLSALPGGYGPGFESGAHYRETLERLDGIREVASVALIRTAPFEPQSWIVPVGQAGQADEVPLAQAFVSHKFFETLGLPLIEGRDFAGDDRPDARHVAILSRNAARAVFGDQSAVGRFIRVGGAPANQRVEVIGVVADASLGQPQQGITRGVYLSFWQYGAAVQAYPTLLVRAVNRRAPDRTAIDAAVGASGREYVSAWRSLEDRRDAALLNEQLLAAVAVAFAGLGLLLAVIGLYGLLSLLVAERSPEFGVRLALGATVSRIGAMILARTATMVGFGIGAGLGGALLMARLLATVLNRPLPVPFSAIVVAIGMMVAAGLLAAIAPVRRAAAVSPLAQLRAE